jgi:hypothetical protein
MLGSGTEGNLNVKADPEMLNTMPVSTAISSGNTPILLPSLGINYSLNIQENGRSLPAGNRISSRSLQSKVG